MRSAQAVIGIQCGVGTVDGVMRRMRESLRERHTIGDDSFDADAVCGEYMRA